MTKNEALFYAIYEAVNIDKFDFQSVVNIDDIDENITFDQLTEIIEDREGFEVDIIYYSNAMKYLMDNDSSLTKSLEIAYNLGFEMDGLNSEVLASLLASEEVKGEWLSLEDDITDIIEEFEWEE